VNLNNDLRKYEMPLFKVMYLRTWRLVNVKWFYLLLYSIALKVFFPTQLSIGNLTNIIF